MDNSFKTLIDSAQEVLILLPSKPFMDQVAGGLSLYLTLSAQNKNVSISCPAQMIAEYSRLIGVDKVTSELGSKNLVIKFKNYSADDIDKVRADIENGEFTLTALPKTGKKSPTREQLEISFTGTAGDLVVLIGGANDTHFPALSNEELKTAKVIHLGTRLLEVLNSDLEILSFARPASSTSELIASLVKESSFPVDEDIATNLLAGIENQSKGFQSSEVTADTFEVFAELLKLGGRRMPQTLAPRNYPQGSIPTKPFNAPVQSATQNNAVVEQPQITDRQMTPEEAEMELEQEIPASWSEPKIFTGTSVS
ncbi:MAG: hypothetical protein WA152_03230 [Microgenomates group bacterium]